jgi:hypothetical protein
MAGPTLHDIASIASTAPISLAEQINASTRPAHSLLNRLIISRLKLAVPPHAEDLSLYGAGLLHVAPVYVTFEAIWDSLLGALPPPADSCAGTPESDFGGDHHTVEEPGASCLSMDSDTPISQRRHALTGRLHYALSNIHLAPLARSSRLRADIKYCLRLSDGDLDKQISLVTSSMPVAQVCTQRDLSRSNCASRRSWPAALPSAADPCSSALSHTHADYWYRSSTVLGTRSGPNLRLS